MNLKFVEQVMTEFFYDLIKCRLDEDLGDLEWAMVGLSVLYTRQISSIIVASPLQTWVH